MTISHVWVDSCAAQVGVDPWLIDVDSTYPSSWPFQNWGEPIHPTKHNLPMANLRVTQKKKCDVTKNTIEIDI